MRELCRINKKTTTRGVMIRLPARPSADEISSRNIEFTYLCGKNVINCVTMYKCLKYASTESSRTPVSFLPERHFETHLIDSPFRRSEGFQGTMGGESVGLSKINSPEASLRVKYLEHRRECEKKQKRTRRGLW